MKLLSLEDDGCQVRLSACGIRIGWSFLGWGSRGLSSIREGMSWDFAALDGAR
jgi:hypothetical protein